MNSITQLTPNLHVTDADGARTLSEDHPFDEVVTLGYVDVFGNEYPDASTTEREYKFRDGPHNYSQFEAAATHVVEHLHAERSVLVHCQAGVSRSPAICIAAIATVGGCSPETARETVADAHPQTNLEPDVWESTVRFVEANR